MAITFAETTALVRARLRWLRGKTAEYERARNQYRDIPPLAIDVSRMVLPVAMVLTAVQRRNAGLLLPFVRKLKSAAVRLNELMPGAIALATAPPMSTPNDLVEELRTLTPDAAAALEKAQQLLAEWAESPAFYHAGRIPRWQAYTFGDPAAVHVDVDAAEQLLVGEQYAEAQQRETRRQQLQREARQELARQTTRHAITRNKQPGPAAGVALGVAVLGLAYLWIRHRG